MATKDLLKKIRGALARLRDYQKANCLFYCDLFLLSISGLYLLFSYLNTEFSLPTIRICPFYLLTSRPCPFCGMTRSIGEILHGHLQKGFQIHPFGIVFLGGWIVLIILSIKNILKKIGYKKVEML
jgi:hypothetical protein